MSVKWEDDEKDHVIGYAMEVCANINNYKGVAILVKKLDGSIDWTWSGPDGEFSSVDVIAMTMLCLESTKMDLLGRVRNREDKEDDSD